MVTHVDVWQRMVMAKVRGEGSDQAQWAPVSSITWGPAFQKLFRKRCTHPSANADCANLAKRRRRNSRNCPNLVQSKAPVTSGLVVLRRGTGGFNLRLPAFSAYGGAELRFLQGPVYSQVPFFRHFIFPNQNIELDHLFGSSNRVTEEMMSLKGRLSISLCGR